MERNIPQHPSHSTRSTQRCMQGIEQETQPTCPQGQIYCQVNTESGPEWACAPPSQCINR
jgi:hypothetical protein